MVEPLVPVVARPSGRVYRRRSGGGRKPMMPRQIFSAIVYVLRSGCPWKALPPKYGSASTVHRHFLQWEREGFFQALWRAGLAEHDEMEGIRWEWKSDTGAAETAARATESAGGHPREPEEAKTQASFVGRRMWRPAIARRQRG